MNVVTTYPDNSGSEAPGNRVKVDIRYTVAISLPYVPRNSISLESFSEMYIIQ